MLGRKHASSAFHRPCRRVVVRSLHTSRLTSARLIDAGVGPPHRSECVDRAQQAIELARIARFDSASKLRSACTALRAQASRNHHAGEPQHRLSPFSPQAQYPNEAAWPMSLGQFRRVNFQLCCSIRWPSGFSPAAQTSVVLWLFSAIIREARFYHQRIFRALRENLRRSVDQDPQAVWCMHTWCRGVEQLDRLLFRPRSSRSNVIAQQMATCAARAAPRAPDLSASTIDAFGPAWPSACRGASR